MDVKNPSHPVVMQLLGLGSDLQPVRPRLEVFYHPSIPKGVMDGELASSLQFHQENSMQVFKKALSQDASQQPCHQNQVFICG